MTTADTLVVMEYTATARFRQIEHHTAVAREDGSLVAVTGPSGDAESEAYAHLFARAPGLLDALKRVAYVAKHRERPSGETYALIIEIAEAAIAKAGVEIGAVK